MHVDSLSQVPHARKVHKCTKFLRVPLLIARFCTRNRPLSSRREPRSQYCQRVKTSRTTNEYHSIANVIFSSILTNSAWVAFTIVPYTLSYRIAGIGSTNNINKKNNKNNNKKGIKQIPFSAHVAHMPPLANVS